MKLFFAALVGFGLSSGVLVAAPKPNVIFILVDDMGYSDLGCYGSEIETPHLDGLAREGLRFTQFYNTAKCFPSRACLLTGVYAQQSGMAGSYGGGFKNAVTIAEVLKPAGYRAYASGKHHSKESLYDRGFDHFYGLLEGACNFWNPGGQQRPGEPPPGNKGRTRPWVDDAKIDKTFTPEKGFYATDAFTDKALQWLDEPQLEEQPFFLYLAYNAPHYPLHAWPKDIAKYKGKYASGYEAIREARYKRMIELGIIDKSTPLPLWTGKAWSALSADAKALTERRMEIYAAMLDSVDQNVGRVLAKLRAQGKLDNTLIMFASDNGGCAEGSGARNKINTLESLGRVESYDTVGKDWATVQNTPLRFWKNSSHEGGIGSPCIAYWPKGIKARGEITHQPGHFIDVMATLVDLGGAEYPATHAGKPVTPMQGVSLRPVFEGGELVREQPLFWQWGSGRAVRVGDLKAVREGKKWYLYDIAKDRNELDDLSAQYPERLQALQAQWQTWFDGTKQK